MQPDLAKCEQSFPKYFFIRAGLTLNMGTDCRGPAAWDESPGMDPHEHDESELLHIRSSGLDVIMY